jgi:DMSO/TMAO reductase YedYZ molybdopterin-dependent catalytic subunit
MAADRAFQGRPRQVNDRVPPGQYVTDDFPVLTAGPTVDIPASEWELTITDRLTSKTYDWATLNALEMTELTTDIHCVTHWTKLNTTWEGVAITTLFDDAGIGNSDFALVSSYGGYTTNLPAIDLTEHDAMIAVRYDGAEIEAEHGGPARLLVPHLYMWKSAKWVREIQLSDQEDQGFWEAAGYHNYGDPWSEQRYYTD